jgi:hypothetical protein
MHTYYCYDDTNNLKPLTKTIFSSIYGEPPKEAYTETVPPNPSRGQVPCFIEGEWVLMEDHRREWGWIDGIPTQITDIGPYPEGFSTQPPPPTQAELNEVARREYLAELDNIDKSTIRALREIDASNDASTVIYARNKLATFETKAEEIRAAMASLESTKQ